MVKYIYAYIYYTFKSMVIGNVHGGGKLFGF